MDSSRELDIANVKALIALRQQEERRLQSIISNPMTSSEVRSQAQDALIKLLRDIQEDAKELIDLEAG